MGLPPVKLWFSILGGQNSQQIETLRQDGELVEMSQALNVIGDPYGDLITSPGFSKVRASAISGTPSITGMFHLGDLADEFILWGSNGKPHRDNANPPGAITGGTDFTTGADVRVRGDIANDLLVCVSSSRNVPQTFNASMTRADLGGTPPRGVDYKYAFRRGFMFAPSDGSTTYRHFASFNSANDDEDAWANPYTINRLNFGRPGTDVNLLGGEYYNTYLMAFTEDRIYPIYSTPNAILPVAFHDSFFSEKGGGPASIHAVVKANERLYWLSKGFDVKVLFQSSVKSIGYPIQPFLRGLNDSRRTQIVGGWEPQYRIVWWAVSDGSDSTHQDAVGLQVDTGRFFFRTIARNSFANRTVSGEIRLIGGGHAGFFYNEFDSSATGDLDDSASAIDADVMTPRHHLGIPGVYKRIPYVAVEFDPVGTEAVTVQYQLDDDQTWTSFENSPITLSGTDTITKKFFIGKDFDRIRLRFRDANSGERFRVKRYGFPKPSLVYTRGN